jgi:hypothetical protein
VKIVGFVQQQQNNTTTTCKLCTSLNLVIRAISDNPMVMKRTSLIGCV